MSKSANAKQKLLVAIEAIDKAIPIAPTEAVPGSRSQLALFRQQLVEYLNALEQAAPPPPWLARSNLGRAIVDSWPLPSELGNAIGEAEGAYLEAIGSARGRQT